MAAQTVYCSRACQDTDWKEHRKLCGTPPQREQPLPSQTAIIKQMNRNTLEQAASSRPSFMREMFMQEIARIKRLAQEGTKPGEVTITY